MAQYFATPSPSRILAAAEAQLVKEGRSANGVLSTAKRHFKSDGYVTKGLGTFDTGLPSLPDKLAARAASGTIDAPDEDRATAIIYGELCPAFRKARPREPVYPQFTLQQVPDQFWHSEART